MPSYNITLSLSTSDDCPSPEAAAEYFASAVAARGLQVTVEDDTTGTQTEVYLR